MSWYIPAHAEDPRTAMRSDSTHTPVIRSRAFFDLQIYGLSS